MVQGIVIWGLALITVAAAIWLTRWRHRRDRRLAAAAQQWTLARGWEFTPYSALTHGWAAPPFNRGTNPRAINVARGHYDGLEATSFTFETVISSGKSSTVEQYSCAMVTLPASLPVVLLRPQRAVHLPDLEFESIEFNRAWQVEAHSPPMAHDLLHPRMMERLLAADARGLTMLVIQNHLVVLSRGIKPLDLRDQWFGLLSDLVALVPRFVWLDAGGQPPALTQDGSVPLSPDVRPPSAELG